MKNINYIPSVFIGLPAKIGEEFFFVYDDYVQKDTISEYIVEENSIKIVGQTGAKYNTSHIGTKLLFHEKSLPIGKTIFE